MYVNVKFDIQKRITATGNTVGVYLSYEEECKKIPRKEKVGHIWQRGNRRQVTGETIRGLAMEAEAVARRIMRNDSMVEAVKLSATVPLSDSTRVNVEVFMERSNINVLV